LQQMGSFLRPLIRHILTKRQEREKLYESLDPFEPSFLQHDFRNFQIFRTDVVRTRFRRNRSHWTPFNVGVVELELLDGTRRRFILVGNQQQEEVLNLLLKFDPAIEVTGKPNPRLPPKPMSPAGRLITAVIAGVLFFCFGAFFAYLAIAGMAKNLGLLFVAALNFLGGLSSLLTAWKIYQNMSIPDEDSD
jgi:hypothetical protein